MREQGKMLEHHTDIALVRRHVRDRSAANCYVAFGELLEACDHPKDGGLATATRAQ